MRADVDAYGATGTWVYTGGLVGSMRNQKTTTTIGHILVENSQNDGTTKGGECLSNTTATGDDATGHSATGGLVGYSLRADIQSCLVNGTVTSHIGTIENDALKYYTIGGIAGSIRAVESGDIDDYPQVLDNDIYATINVQLSESIANHCFIGWLAGVAPPHLEPEQTLPNHCFVTTSFNKIGREDESTPSGQSGN